MIPGLTNRVAGGMGGIRGGEATVAWHGTRPSRDGPKPCGNLPGTYRAIRFHLRIFVLNDPNGATVFT